jgi:hypothetical protein
MIGAGPGEKLPPFPKRTHSGHDKGPVDGTKKHVTAAVALRKLHQIHERQPVDNHNPQGVTKFVPPKAPWDGNRLLPRTITTSGGENYYFTGERSLTLRELATLQGFPTEHRFQVPEIRKQIGNAFPPLAAKALFKAIEKFLLKVDNMISPNNDDDEDNEDGEGDEIMIDAPDVIDLTGDDEIITPPVVSRPVVSRPVVYRPVVSSPVVATPVVATPVVATPVVLDLAMMDIDGFSVTARPSMPTIPRGNISIPNRVNMYMA